MFLLAFCYINERLFQAGMRIQEKEKGVRTRESVTYRSRNRKGRALGSLYWLGFGGGGKKDINESSDISTSSVNLQSIVCTNCY